MTYNGNANVIILGHGSVFEEIRSHVADLVAMNQVRRSFWIDTATGLSDAAVRVCSNTVMVAARRLSTWTRRYGKSPA